MAQEPAFLPRGALDGPKLAELAQLDDVQFREMFSKTSIKRSGRDRFIRNVMIAIGNSGDSSLIEVAQARKNDASEIVREMASWAIAELS